MASTPAPNGRALLEAAKAARLYVPGPRDIKFVNGPMPGYGEIATIADPSTSTVYWQGHALGRFARAHETGHIFDAQALADGDRRYFQKLMHAPAGAWDQGTGVTGFRSPKEWFADYYAASAIDFQPRTKTGGSDIASYAPLGPKRLERFKKALTRLGQRQDLPQYR